MSLTLGYVQKTNWRRGARLMSWRGPEPRWSSMPVVLGGRRAGTTLGAAEMPPSRDTLSFLVREASV